MKLIVGLGNPGEKYSESRHNTGFVVLDKLAQELGIKNYELSKKFQSLITKNPSLIFAKPQTFMNDSGIAVSSLAAFYKLPATDIFVIHDDLDIKLGEYKIQKGKGPREHNGLLSIYEKLGHKDFWHVRVGIDNREVSNVSKVSQVPNVMSGQDYVLQKFSEEERKVLNATSKKVVGELLLKLIK